MVVKTLFHDAVKAFFYLLYVLVQSGHRLGSCFAALGQICKCVHKMSQTIRMVNVGLMTTIRRPMVMYRHACGILHNISTATTQPVIAVDFGAGSMWLRYDPVAP